MTTEQKYKLSRDIVASLSKIAHYEDAINRIVKNEKLFIDASLTCRLNGIRNNIWVDLEGHEVIYILKKRIVTEKIVLTKLELQIK